MRQFRDQKLAHTQPDRSLRAGERDWRNHRGGDHDRTDVRVDINFGRPAPRYEERTTRVWVESVYRTECDRVWVEPVYRDECERVWVPSRRLKSVPEIRQHPGR